MRLCVGLFGFNIEITFLWKWDLCDGKGIRINILNINHD